MAELAGSAATKNSLNGGGVWFTVAPRRAIVAPPPSIVTSLVIGGRPSGPYGRGQLLDSSEDADAIPRGSLVLSPGALAWTKDGAPAAATV